MKNCEIGARLPAVTPSPCEKNYFLQNKLPAVSRHTEPVRKKLLFAKQTAGYQRAKSVSAFRFPRPRAFSSSIHLELLRRKARIIVHMSTNNVSQPEHI